MELRFRAQKDNEPLQAFAMEVERLVPLAYQREKQPLLDNNKTEAFVIGIRDPDIKPAVCSTQETARVISGPQVSKLPKIEVVEEEESLLNKIKEMLKQVLEENGQAKLKCFNCGKSGNF